MTTPGLVRHCSVPSAATSNRTAARVGNQGRCARHSPRRQDAPAGLAGTDHPARAAASLCLTAVPGRDRPDCRNCEQALGHTSITTTMNYIHVHASHIEDALRSPARGGKAAAWKKISIEVEPCG